MERLLSRYTDRERVLNLLDINSVADLPHPFTQKAEANKNLEVVVDNHAQPYIPFKSNSPAISRSHGTRKLWQQMFHP